MDMPRVDLVKCQPKDYDQEIIDESNLSAMSISTKDEDEDSIKNWLNSDEQKQTLIVHTSELIDFYWKQFESMKKKRKK